MDTISILILCTTEIECKDMDKRKTAVEWLVEQVNSDCLNSAFIRPDLIKEAMQMEKQQTIEAYIEGFNDPHDGHELVLAHDYHEFTYGGVNEKDN